MNPEKENLLNPTVLDKRYPNSIVCDEFGKIYVGDSLGGVHIWEVKLINDLKISKIKSISHKKLEGDEINCLRINPGDKAKLLVHSRDNSIRLVNPFGKNGKLTIENEYKGLKCNRFNIKSVISPDGEYVLSGSEEGMPKLWNLQSGFSINKEDYFECKFIDSVCDVTWNSHYNMLALSGFGQEYPILVFVYEKDLTEVEISNAVLLIKESEREKLAEEALKAS